MPGRLSSATGLIIGFAWLILLPTIASAQAPSGLAGVVRDATGGVLPGVTVEASSPALIEKVRTATTDEQGQYKIVDLRPGMYAVTFTLTGFTTYKRDGIDLPSAFTATVNAELRVGAVEETITVSVEASTVDVQNVSRQTVLSTTVLDSLPSQRSPQSYVPFIPGVTGGLGNIGLTAGFLAIHGGRTGEANVALDGVAEHTFEGPGAYTYYINQGSVQEMAVSTGAQSVEQGGSGITTNLVLKDGSNTFTGNLFLGYSGESMQSNNLTDALRATGLTAVNRIQKIWDINPSWGGRIVRDKLWFYNSYRYWGTISYLAGLYRNATPLAWNYTPDLDQQAVGKIVDGSTNIRLTYQATPKNKFSFFYDHQPHCTCNYPGFSATVSPEATGWGKWSPNTFRQASWKSPLSNRLYVEGSASQLLTNWHVHSQIDPFVDPDAIGVTAQTGTVLSYRAYTDTRRGNHQSNPFTTRAAVNYVTGSHAFKIGFIMMRGHRFTTQEFGGDVTYRVTNALTPVPNQITEYATPLTWVENLNADLGIYGQDQWTTKRLTLNLGLRLDYFNASVPEQSLPATRFVPARSYAAVKKVPEWEDLNPRLGAAYDVFGDGKTAFKFNIGRYVAGETVGTARNNNPVQTSITSTTRVWTDGNRDFVPDCVLTNPLANGECAQISNLSFGQPNVIATRYDPDLITGFGKRGYNWEVSTSIQRELWSGFSVTGEYDRRWYGNQTVTDNLSQTPQDYDTYCVNAPVDARLPDGGGNQICGLYDLNPRKFGLTDNVVTFAKNFGGQTEVYNGFDLTMSARLPKGARVSGGTSTGHVVTNTCDLIVDSPDKRYCKVSPPLQTQVKAFFIIPLPWDIQASAGLQVVPGPQITAAYVLTNALVSPSLLRSLSGSAPTIALISPGTQYMPMQKSLDFRASRRVKFRGATVTGSIDVFNVLNRGDVNTVNTSYPNAWLQPTQTLVPRYAKVGAQVEF